MPWDKWDKMPKEERLELLKAYPKAVGERLSEMSWDEMSSFDQWHVTISFTSRRLR